MNVTSFPSHGALSQTPAYDVRLRIWG